MVEFHVNEHNTKMPHPAFSGQTPNEIFLGTGAKVPDALGLAKGNARAGTVIPSAQTIAITATAHTSKFNGIFVPPAHIV